MSGSVELGRIFPLEICAELATFRRGFVFETPDVGGKVVVGDAVVAAHEEPAGSADR